MAATYDQIVASFKPQFGNANHIAAVPLIEQVSKLRASLAKRKPGGKPPTALIKELNTLEGRIVSLLSLNAPMSTYPPTNPQL